MCDELEDFEFLFGFGNKHSHPEYCDDVWHYTSPHGFNSILTQDKDRLTLRASRIDCLNDITEGKYIKGVYDKVCRNLLELKEINRDQYTDIQGLSPSNERTFYFTDHYSDDKKTNSTYGFVSKSSGRTYVASFSKSKDLLPMWNYYVKGNKYEGFNLGFWAGGLRSDLKTLYGRGDNITIQEVVYDAAEQEMEVKSFLIDLLQYYKEENIPQIKNLIVSFLNKWSICFKNSCFSHENEVRIIVGVPVKTLPFIEKYDVSSSLIKPYIELKFAKENMHSVTIAPTQKSDSEKENQINIASDFLNINGYRDCDIKYSEVPVRY